MAEHSLTITEESIRRQSPLLWLAIPGALGIAAAERLSFAGNFSSIFFVSAILSATVFGNLLLYEKRGLAKIFFVIFAFSIGAFHYFERVPQNPYPQWNTRETQLMLSVERADSNQKGSSYGFARVVSSSEYFKGAQGHKIWFYVADNPDISRGDKLSGIFVVRSAEQNEGFDEYLSSQKVYFNAAARADINVIKGGFPYSFYNAARRFIAANLSVFPSEEDYQSAGANAFRAMILGEKSLLDAEAKSHFTATGTMHIFAISGLHVGLIAAAIYGILKILRLPQKIRPIVCLPVLFLYVNACGARPSAMRAFTMIALMWIAISLLRKPKSFAGFVAAFCFSLALRPADLFDAGFALSYAVVASILLYSVPMIDAIKRKTRKPFYKESEKPKLRLKAADYAIAAFAISFAAIFASAPLSSAYFGYIAPLAFPYSIVYVAAASIVVTMGLWAMILPNFIAQYTNLLAIWITNKMLLGASIGAEANMLVNLKISGVSAFLIESALVCVLLLGHRIPEPWKWFAFPTVSVAGILVASFFVL